MPRKKKGFELPDVKHAARGQWEDIFARFNITVPKKDTPTRSPSFTLDNFFSFLSFCIRKPMVSISKSYNDYLSYLSY